MGLRIFMTNFNEHIELLDDKNVTVAKVMCEQPVGPDDPGPWQDQKARRLAMLFRSAPELAEALQGMLFHHGPRNADEVKAETAARDALRKAGVEAEAR